MKIIIKKSYIFVLLCILLGITFVYTLFIMRELHTNVKSDDQFQVDYEKLKSIVDNLELKAKENANALDNLAKLYRDFSNSKNRGNVNQIIEEKIILNHLKDQQTEKVVKNEIVVKKEAILEQCEWIQKTPTKTNISMLSVYDELPFDDIDGGVWKQGWDITYHESQWSYQNKLEVVIIPHSHNDPGWLMTFEEYFNQRTKFILNTIVDSLSEKESRKFVWAETSYLYLWWNQANNEMKDKMRKLISNGQLEIVTGGWVMNDEANTHYYAMIEQMIEGHEWLRANIDKNIIPENGWSIDPFGYSPTMAYLLKQMGFKNMLIQRVHYRIKKYLAQNKKLEFYWSQLWDRNQNTKIFTHVMPFYSYDVPHTCGPNPSVCCQFDFRRVLVDPQMSCPWGKQPVEITSANLEERANLLLDQYRKKNQLYAHNVVLIPLGDDFRYTSMNEANAQYNNYEKLIEYMNSRADWNVNAQFGTLNDYFNLVEKKKSIVHEMPTLNGDFFTYADRQDHYWSGYYTSRPLYKRLDRTVEYYLRTAEILFTFANLNSLENSAIGGTFNRDELYKLLLTARRNLGLFQHHDGITGTAKTAVNNDYGAKLLESIKNSQKIVQESIEFLLKSKTNIENSNFLVVDDSRLTHDALTTRNVLKLVDGKDRRIYVFNSNEHKRIDIITIYVDTPFVEVYDENDVLINDNYQLNLLWSKQQTDQMYLEHESDSFELLIQVEMNAFEIKSFKIKNKNDVKDVNSYLDKYFTKNTFLTQNSVDSSHLNLINQRLEEKKLDKNLIEFIKLTDYKDNFIELSASNTFKAYFDSKYGLLKKLVDKQNNQEYKINMRIVSYGVTNAREKSGAYLFLPNGRAQELELNSKLIHIEKGSIRNRLCTNLLYLVQCVEFYPFKSTKLNDEIPAVNVWNLVDIRPTSNFELAINIETDINNNDFYTDLNSFQFIRRKTYDKIPIQANVYPMPSASYIHDDKLRLTALSAQTLGVCSLEKSHLEIFLDRRLAQDDNRGLEQPVLDNKLTSSRFILVFEKIKERQNENLLQPNLNIQMKLFDLQHPLTTLLTNNDNNNLNNLPKVINLMPDSTSIAPIPCDLRVLNIRTLQTQDEKPSNSVALIIHRLGYNCEQKETCSTNFNFNFKNLISFKKINEIKKTYLNLIKDPNKTDVISETKSIVELVEPMEIQAFRIEF